MPEYEGTDDRYVPVYRSQDHRFNNIHKSLDELNKKVKLQRLMGQRTGSCFQRCVIMDAGNAFYSTTYEIDQTHGTDILRSSRSSSSGCRTRI